MKVLENLLTGVIGSLFATVLFLLYTIRREKKIEEEKYAASVGKYIGYGTTEQQGTIINKEKPLSKVEITYQSGNLLKLVLKEINNTHEWHGLILMKTLIQTSTGLD